MRILILSRNPSLYSTQSLVRACYRRGHFARVVDHLQCDLVVEQGNLSVFYQGDELHDYQAIIPRIGSSVTNYGANVIRQFEKMGIFTVSRAQSILRTRNKWQCFQILAAENIPIPRSLLPNYQQFDDQMMRNFFDEPLIVKLLESTHGLGVILSESYQNAFSTIEAFQRLKKAVLMQEFVKESKGADIRVLVVDGEVVASMKRQAQGNEFRSNLHRGATASIIQLTEKEILLARKVCKLMGLSVAGVDILRSNRGPMILEINSSPGLEGIETTTGIDVAGKVIKYIERQVRKREKYRLRKAK